MSMEGFRPAEESRQQRGRRKLREEQQGATLDQSWGQAPGCRLGRRVGGLSGLVTCGPEF